LSYNPPPNSGKVTMAKDERPIPLVNRLDIPEQPSTPIPTQPPEPPAGCDPGELIRTPPEKYFPTITQRPKGPDC
jgi:hypothetical protein